MRIEIRSFHDVDGQAEGADDQEVAVAGEVVGVDGADADIVGGEPREGKDGEIGKAERPASTRRSPAVGCPFRNCHNPGIHGK